MRKEKQIGVRVGLPAFFALELEDVYRHTEGAHRALAFPDFIGLLVGIGLEQYRKGNATAPNGKALEGIEGETPEGEEWDWQDSNAQSDLDCRIGRARLAGLCRPATDARASVE